MRVFTHDRIKLSTGLFAATGLLWGQNALQNIAIGRHLPINPAQAVGYLGTVDYVSGIITSDVTLDTILVEGCNKADTSENRTNSVYRFANVQTDIANESYVMTSAAVQFTAGSPATANFGYLTNGLATYLDVQDQPNPESGEESRYAVVMGDDGSGLELVPTWVAAYSPAVASTIPIISSAGARSSISDNSLPAGVQQLGFNGTINRDNILDFRTAQPCSFVTTYPINITANIECYELPVATGVSKQGDVAFAPGTFVHGFKSLRQLKVAVPNPALGKHDGASTINTPTGQVGPTLASAGDVYVHAIGMKQIDEQEGIQVGRYLTFTINFNVADLVLPMAAPA